MILVWFSFIFKFYDNLFDVCAKHMKLPFKKLFINAITDLKKQSV